MPTDTTDDTKRVTLRLSKETARKELSLTELVEEICATAVKGVK